MFVLSEMQDIIRIEPWKFNEDTKSVIVDTLNSKFANKVVYNVGLCIRLFDITEVGDSYIFPGDGSSHTKVRFRCIVFRPFIDEVIVGKIKSSSPDGIRVQLGFFDDILIPPQNLQHPSKFNAREQVWVWEYEVAEEGSNEMFMDSGDEIRFRVTEEIFVDISPSAGKAPPKIPQVNQDSGLEVGVADGFDLKEEKIPYTILGSVSESGLGMTSWWT